MILDFVEIVAFQIPIFVFLCEIAVRKTKIKDVFYSGPTALVQEDLSLFSIASATSCKIKLVLSKRADPAGTPHVFTLWSVPNDIGGVPGIGCSAVDVQ